MSGERDGSFWLNRNAARWRTKSVPELTSHVLLYCFITFVQICCGLIYRCECWIEKPPSIRVIPGSIAVSS
jgi:hypothetical protein